MVTNSTEPVALLAQLYRDRADCENVFDEIKNQWGWAGFVTRDLERCRRVARLIALIYNWWTIFTRLAVPQAHREAITSRPLLLEAVGRLVSTGRRRILRLTSTHAQAEPIQQALNGIARFLDRLEQTAEQLGREVVWAMLLSVAFVKWLRGKVLHPLANGPQVVLQLQE
ncbi:MAG: transposase [Verrucomicrobiales bacterium]|nr:transposase [Verrucomicrobiales bacterium]